MQEMYYTMYQYGGGIMRTLTREQLLGAGLLSGLMAFVGMSYGADQPSVAHAALNAVNNRASSAREFGQTIPDPTETPIATPENSEPTPTVPPIPMDETPTSVPATETPANPTPTPENGPTPTPADVQQSIGVVVFDAQEAVVSDVSVHLERQNPTLILNDVTNDDGTFTLDSFAPGISSLELSTEGPNEGTRAEYAFENASGSYAEAVVSHNEGEDLSSTMHISFTEPVKAAGVGQPASEVTATVGLNSLSLRALPENMEVSLTDFEVNGTLSYQPLTGAVQSASSDSASQWQREGKFAVSAQEADADGFGIDITQADGDKVTAVIDSSQFMTGTLVFDAAQAGTTLEIQKDTDGDGIPDTTVHIPAEIDKPVELTHRVYIPLLTK